MQRVSLMLLVGVGLASVAGLGTASHLSAERFRLSADFQAVHVPFKGGGEALTEVIAGRAEFYFCPIANALPMVREGTVVALAVPQLGAAA